MVLNLPLVSICIPTYNGAKYLAEALESAIAQTYRPLEIIISDDDSKDRTLQIVEEYQNKTNIPFFIFQHKPSGIGENWNNCIKLANGAYIKFLFQDDILERDCISQMIKPVIDFNNNIGLVFCKRKFIFNPQNEKENEWVQSFKDVHSSWTLLKPIQKGKDLLKDKNLLKHPRNKVGEPATVLLKKEVFDKVGYFNTVLKQALDYEFWYRVFTKYDVAFINSELVYFRLHENQATVQNSKQKIIDYELYPELMYKNCFKYLHNQNKIKLFFRYNIVGKLVFKLIDICKKYMR